MPHLVSFCRSRTRIGWRTLSCLLLIANGATVPVSAQEGTADQNDEGLESRPNMILIMADDLGWGDPAYYGHSNLSTPALDRMAADGMRFDRFYAAAPVCSPTRASCLTGRHPYRQGIFFANSGHLLERERNLAEVLADAGYQTGHFGKWHLGTLTVDEKDSNRGGPDNRAHFAPPWEHGFQATFSTEAKVPTWDPLLRPKGVNRKNWWDAIGDDDEAVPYGTSYWINGEKCEEELRGDDSALIMDHAISFIDQAAANDAPFFTVIWFHTPHLPVVGGEPWTEQYADESDYAKHYKASVSAMDAQLDRLRERLEALGQSDSTLICFCSDNGPEGSASAPGSVGGLRGRKRSLYEGGIRVPGLMVWPGRIKAGSSTDLPASTSDYFLTLLDLASVEVPDDREIDGMSLATWIDELPENRDQPICFESRSQLAVIDDRFKLVLRGSDNGSGKVNVTPDGPTPDWDAFVLYDLDADPSESEPVHEEFPNEVKRLHDLLVKWRASCQQSRLGIEE